MFNSVSAVALGMAYSTSQRFFGLLYFSVTTRNKSRKPNLTLAEAKLASCLKVVNASQL